MKNDTLTKITRTIRADASLTAEVQDALIAMMEAEYGKRAEVTK
jgi:hypothetical protein